MTGDRWQVLSGRGPAAGGRRPLNPATEPFRAKGTAVAKRYRRGGSSSCRSFKPFPSKLVYSRFPPGPRRLPWDPVFLQWRCFPAFSTCQTGRHRRCPKRAPRDLQEGSKRAPKEPPDHQIPSVFFDFSRYHALVDQYHQSASPYGVLEHSMWA